MLQVLLFIFGSVAIVMGTKSVRSKEIFLRREITHADGTTSKAKYLHGTSAVVAGIGCIVIGCGLIVFAIILPMFTR